MKFRVQLLQLIKKLPGVLNKVRKQIKRNINLKGLKVKREMLKGSSKKKANKKEKKLTNLLKAEVIVLIFTKIRHKLNCLLLILV